MSNGFGFGFAPSGAATATPAAREERGRGANDLSAMFELAAGMPFPSKEHVGESLKALGEVWPMVFASLVAAFYVLWHPRFGADVDGGEFGGDDAIDSDLVGAPERGGEENRGSHRSRRGPGREERSKTIEE